MAERNTEVLRRRLATVEQERDALVTSLEQLGDMLRASFKTIEFLSRENDAQRQVIETLTGTTPEGTC